ncbi:unnamed protein product [Didymodactylos carnosus]|nr:unnamed protein product [Didymodactylos carnosus]CAF3728070.1 unnamed protein product [Didymodactylos carnosus]
MITINKLSLHYEGIMDLTEMKDKCMTLYQKQSCSMICNVSKEYRSLLATDKNPLNISEKQPCIDRNRVGNGINVLCLNNEFKFATCCDVKLDCLRDDDEYWCSLQTTLVGAVAKKIKFLDKF